MFDINQLTQEISITRGDSAQFAININAGTELCPIQYRLTDKDVLYIGIEEPNQPFEHAIVKKVAKRSTNIFDKDDNIIIELIPEDTECLMPGLYYYEVKLVQGNNESYRNLYTIINFIQDTNNENQGTFTIINEENTELIMQGTYDKINSIYFLRDLEGNVHTATLINDILELESIRYKKEKAKVSTIIPQTRFIIER